MAAERYVGASHAECTPGLIFRAQCSAHWAATSAGSCRLDMVLYSEEVRSAAQSALYPVNSLRNAALTQAQTEVRAAGERRLLLITVPALCRIHCRTGSAHHSEDASSRALLARRPYAQHDWMRLLVWRSHGAEHSQQQCYNHARCGRQNVARRLSFQKTLSVRGRAHTRAECPLRCPA